MHVADLEAAHRVEAGVALAQVQPAVGDRADPAPRAVAKLEHLLDEGLGLAVAGLVHDDAPIGVLDLAPPLVELADGGEHAGGEIERLEARHHDRHLVLAGDRQVLPVPHDRADVTGGEEGLHAVVRRFEDRPHRAGHARVGDDHRVVLEPPAIGLDDAHRVRRRRRLEADGEEDHVAIGVLRGDGDGVERRVHDADVAAGGPHGEEVALRSRDPQHVAEAREDDAGPAGDGEGAVDHLQRRHAHRAARTVHERDRVGEDAIETAADERVGLAPADLHEHARARRLAADVVEDAADERRVAELRQVLHGSAPGASPSSSSMAPSSRRTSSVRCASASSIVLMAKPTCTST
jgi:hypothetical protein